MEINDRPVIPRRVLIPPGEVHFTAREKQVLMLLAAGLTQPEVAKVLYIGDNTVKTHTLRMRERTGTSTTVELIAYSLAFRLIDLGEVRNAVLHRLVLQSQEEEYRAA